MSRPFAVVTLTLGLLLPVGTSLEASPAPDSAQSDHEFDNGSGITPRALSPQAVDDLVLLGRVWGFAKYHHPRVVGGEVNWDYELFRVLPTVLKAPDRTGALHAMAVWLDRLGDPVPCPGCAPTPDDAVLCPEMDWIGDEAMLGADLSGHLRSIYEGRTGATKQYYVSVDRGHPSFTNESRRADDRSPDAGYRLLAVYRLWNTIRYWYPNRDVIGEDWVGVLRTFVPEVMAEQDSTAYRRTMTRMIARIHDGHANLWSHPEVRPPSGEAQVPVTARFIDGSAVVTDYIDDELGPASGLRIGDVITAVDGTPVDSLVRAWAPYYGASNREAQLQDIGQYLTRGPPGPVRLDLDRGNGPMSLTTDRVPISLMLASSRGHDRRGPAFQMLSPEVAYLKLAAFERTDLDEYLRKAASTEVLVVDIRSHPTDFPVYVLGAHFVTRETPFARFTGGDVTNPGTFVWTATPSLQPSPPHYGGRLVVLVDEESKSQSEFTAMAFRAAGALLVGSTTAGADGDMAYIKLPGHLTTAISGIGVFYPNGNPTQRVGIVPDLEVRPTIQGIRAGRDEVLEAAVSAALGRAFQAPGR